MSIGEPHAEVDKSKQQMYDISSVGYRSTFFPSVLTVVTTLLIFALSFPTGGSGCTAYDVVINPEFYARLHSSKVLMGFFLSVVIEGLESKYDISVDRGLWAGVLWKRKSEAATVFDNTVAPQNSRQPHFRGLPFNVEKWAFAN